VPLGSVKWSSGFVWIRMRTPSTPFHFFSFLRLMVTGSSPLHDSSCAGAGSRSAPIGTLHANNASTTFGVGSDWMLPCRFSSWPSDPGCIQLLSPRPRGRGARWAARFGAAAHRRRRWPREVTIRMIPAATNAPQLRPQWRAARCGLATRAGHNKR